MADSNNNGKQGRNGSGHSTPEGASIYIETPTKQPSGILKRVSSAKNVVPLVSDEIKQLYEDSRTSIVTEAEVTMLHKEAIPQRDMKDFHKKFKTVSCTESCVKTSLQKYLPILEWLPNYNIKEYALTDFSTGFTLGIILIPQGLSYGLLAGLPPIYGLYACLAAPCLYAVLGTSVEASVGPFALISILVANTISDVVSPEGKDEQAYVNAVLATNMLVGLFLIILGIFQLGFIVHFLSDPVLSSLTTGGAFLIATSQVKHFLGLDIPRGSFFSTWKDVFKNIADVNVATLLIGLAMLLTLILIDQVNKRVKLFKKYNIPGALVCLIFSTIVVHFGNLERYGVRVLGDVPAGLPHPKVPDSSDISADLVVPALIIAIVGYTLSMATAKTFAEKRKDKSIVTFNANQEFFALGIANLIGSFFLGYPSFFSLSRSAIAFSSEAKSQIHAIVSVVVVIFVLLFLTHTLYSLPYSCLSAIIFYALRSVFRQLKKLPALFRADTLDFLVWIVTFVSVLGLGIAYGLGIGVAVSMLVLVYSISYPNVAIMGRLPALPWLFKDTSRFADAEELNGILIFRFDSSLNFANKDFFRKSLRKSINARKENGSSTLHSVVIDASSITRIDSSALEALKKTQKEVADMDIEMILCHCRGTFRDALIRYSVTLPRYVSLDDGVRYAEGKQFLKNENDSGKQLKIV